MNPTSRILDMCREGRITPHDAAMLLELRRQIAWRRRRPVRLAIYAIMCGFVALGLLVLRAIAGTP